MRSTEFLAAALADYEGCLCTISHDREFLDGIINRVWEVNNGVVKEYVGNYTDYEWAKEKEAETEEQKQSSNKPLTNSATQKDKERKRQEAEERNKRHRLLKPLKDKLQVVEKSLEEIMQTKSVVELELAEPGIYQEDQKPRLLKALNHQKELVCEENNLLGEWEELSAQVEELS
jgi:ATP-binding cassette subfamily F protein 3